MREFIALFIIFFGLLSFGQENQISKSNRENFKNDQAFDSTFQNRINEEDLIGVWYTTAIAHSKYRSNPYPRFKDRYSFKKDFSIVFVKNKKITSGTWSLSANNILTITTISGKIVYQIRAFKNGTLTLSSSNNYITLKKN
ncbi:lipocalin family protein [Maribacter sp. 2304DJ31-5]|uniref:lipocalin family protein n=1 Tax=Maribacter sp. 2304DJ31-5 TaxID=3386273 RepID=UPI0039BD6BE1